MEEKAGRGRVSTATMSGVIAIVAGLGALPAFASLTDCARNTHTYAGEADHVALSENRVAFHSWWAQLGQAHDLLVMSCETGKGFAIRTQEIEMTHDRPFDRRKEAWDMLAKMEISGFVFSMTQMKDRFVDARFKIQPAMMEEICACEAIGKTQ